MTTQISGGVYQASQQKSRLYRQLKKPEPVYKQTVKHTGSNHKIVVETLSIYKKELS